MAKRNARNAIAEPTLATGPSLFERGGGRWATQQLKAAALSGRELTSQALRTLDTLRHEEWKFFDDVVIREAIIRLVGVKDLMSMGLTKTVPNALGKTVFGYERLTDLDPADLSLDGLTQSPNDRQEFDLNQIPLPILHKDFFVNLRTLAASRNKGEPLDTTQAQTASRVVNELAEKILFQGSVKKFGGLNIYGYMTHPDRNVAGFDGTKNWADATKTGDSFMKDVITAITALNNKRMFGPFMIYVSADAGVRIENDYIVNAGATAQINRTLRDRIEAVRMISGIRVADQLPTGNVLFVQMTSDVVCWVQGEPLQTVQWDEYGGFRINFKVWQIAVPLIRSDIQGRSGIFHFS